MHHADLTVVSTTLVPVAAWWPRVTGGHEVSGPACSDWATTSLRAQVADRAAWPRTIGRNTSASGRIKRKLSTNEGDKRRVAGATETREGGRPDHWKPV